MRRFGAVVALALALAGCGSPPHVPVQPMAYRDPGAGLSSIAALDMMQLAGSWPVRARFGPGAPSFDIPPTLSGPGRFIAPGRDGAPREYWVLWADADYRVAVLGVPEGDEGMILGREAGGLSPDLGRAARDMLAWNGYDLGKLSEVTP